MGAVAGLVFTLSANLERTANLRDILIVVLAFVTLHTNLVTGLLIGLLIYRVQGLVVMVRQVATLGGDPTEMEPPVVGAALKVLLKKTKDV